MKFALKATFVAVLLLCCMVGCTKGPGRDQNFDGTYNGHLTGNPQGDITLEISGSDISGSGELDPLYSWRGKGDPPHYTFTGSLNGRDVLITAPILMEFNSAAFGEPPLWVDVTTTLTLTGRVNDSGAIIGNFRGPNPINEDIPFSGSWSALPESRGSGVTKYN